MTRSLFGSCVFALKKPIATFRMVEARARFVELLVLSLVFNIAHVFALDQIYCSTQNTGADFAGGKG